MRLSHSIKPDAPEEEASKSIEITSSENQEQTNPKRIMEPEISHGATFDARMEDTSSYSANCRANNASERDAPQIQKQMGRSGDSGQDLAIEAFKNMSKDEQRKHIERLQAIVKLSDSYKGDRQHTVPEAVRASSSSIGVEEERQHHIPEMPNRERPASAHPHYLSATIKRALKASLNYTFESSHDRALREASSSPAPPVPPKDSDSRPRRITAMRKAIMKKGVGAESTEAVIEGGGEEGPRTPGRGAEGRRHRLPASPTPTALPEVPAAVMASSKGFIGELRRLGGFLKMKLSRRSS